MGPYVHVAALEHDHAIAIKWAWLQLHDCFFCAETWHKTSYRFEVKLLKINFYRPPIIDS